MSELPRRFRAQAEQCGRHGSPLTAALLSGAADDYEAGGPVQPLLAQLEHLPSGSVPSLRFAGALHRMVLEGRAPTLAAYYPSVGGTAGPEGAWAVARSLVAERADELAVDIQRPVQTNEVGRAAALYGGLLHVASEWGLPIRLLEVGASAGLNLRPERFAYELGGGTVLGDAASPVRLRDPWRGTSPPYDVDLVVSSRAGCDPSPLDPTDDADKLTLLSYVWADQVDRVERLRGALQVAAEQRVAVEALPASQFLRRELATPVAGTATVVWHSVVRQYLAPDELAEVDALLAAAGERATADAPLIRLSLEPEKKLQLGFRFLVQMTTWPGGQARVLAECLGHGPPVTWQ
ncbi:MAG: hypothetical protein QOI82_331 [Actinomycetota bacterium]|jgi:hypothetical protein|nr:hypothetical protein [Actinomycetota bacterium]